MATPAESASSPSINVNINDSWSDTWEAVRQFSLNIISSCEVLISEEHPKIEQIINIFHKALEILLLVNSSSKKIYNGDTLLSTFSRPPEVSVSPVDIQSTPNPLTSPIVSSNIPPISPLLQRVQLHVSQQQYYQGTFTPPLNPHFTIPQVERPLGNTTTTTTTTTTSTPNPSSTSPHQQLLHTPLLQSLDPLRILVSSLYDTINQSRNQNFAINSLSHINPFLLHHYSPQLPNVVFSQSPNMLSPQFIPQVMFPSSRDQGLTSSSLKMPPNQPLFPEPHTLLGVPDTPPPMREFTIISESGSSSPKRKRRSRAPAPDLEGLFCHSCGETQTSQWRRGPDGRKSLCNACGIRFANMVNREKSVPMKDTQISVDMLLNRPSSSTTTETPLSTKPSRLLNDDTAENSSNSGSISPRGGHNLRRGTKAGGRGLIKSSSSSNLVMKANKPDIPRSNSGSNIVGTTTPTEVSLLKRDSSFSRSPLSPLLSLSIKERSEEGLSDLAEAIAVSTSSSPPQTTVHKKITTDQSTQRSSTPPSTHNPSSPLGSPTQNLL